MAASGTTASTVSSSFPPLCLAANPLPSSAAARRTASHQDPRGRRFLRMAIRKISRAGGSRIARPIGRWTRTG